MKTIGFAIGFLWALPISIFGFLLALFLYLNKQIKRVYFRKDFTIGFDLENNGWFYKKKFQERGWIGFSCGCNIFIKDANTNNLAGLFRVGRTIKHEKRHCYQQFVLGVFLPIVYILNSICIWFFEKENHSYYDNWFEIDAREHAGQEIKISKKQWKDGPLDRWAWW